MALRKRSNAQQAADRRRAQRRLAREVKGGRQQSSEAGRAYRLAVERRRTGKTKAQREYEASHKAINLVAQTGISAEVVSVPNLNLRDRRAVVRHWILIQDYLNADSPQKAEQAARKIRAYEGRTIGGYEYANDPEAIKQLALSDPDSVDMNQNMYLAESE